MRKARHRTTLIRQRVQRLSWHHARWSLLLIVPLLGWYAYEVWVARPAMAWMGLPQATQVQPAYWTHVLRNEGFMLGYSELRGNPLWVTYHLTASNGGASRYKRPGRFETDWRSLARIGHDDYARSGYTRGHLAPSHTIAQYYGRAAQLDTFLMTNVSPQRPELNNKVWQSIEKWETDTAVRRYGNVWVITGPIFDNAVERLTSSLQVEIPDAFYKIVVVPEDKGRDAPIVHAFIVPQKVTGTETMESFLTSVDRVEELSGFDFFSELPDELERPLESGTAAL